MNQSHGESRPPVVAVVEDALATLEAEVVLTEAVGPDSHTVLICSGVEAPAVISGFGRYLAGVLANIVGVDAGLSGELLAGWTDARSELEIELDALLGPDNDFVDEDDWKRTSVRNPWIAEGIAHAMLVIRSRSATDLLPGKVHALKRLHHRPNIPGIDLLAIYEGETLEVMVGECKATKSNGNKHLQLASEFFAKVDAGDYGGELRIEIAALRTAIPEPLRGQATNALWKQHRCYIPAIAYAEEFNPRTRRQHLANLVPPPSHRRMVAIELADYDAFFDAIANAVRATVAEVAF